MTFDEVTGMWYHAKAKIVVDITINRTLYLIWRALEGLIHGMVRVLLSMSTMVVTHMRGSRIEGSSWCRVVRLMLGAVQELPGYPEEELLITQPNVITPKHPTRVVGIGETASIVSYHSLW